VEVGPETSQVDYQRGFLEGLEYLKSKIQKKTLQEALGILDEVVGVVKKQRFSSIDEALMILE